MKYYIKLNGKVFTESSDKISILHDKYPGALISLSEIVTDAEKTKKSVILEKKVRKYVSNKHMLLCMFPQQRTIRWYRDENKVHLVF